MLDYISDGYTESAYIEASRGFHGQFRFKFRPCDPMEQGALLERSEKLSLDKERATLADALAPKIMSWSLTDREGCPVPVSAAMLRMLRPRLFGRVTKIILGLEAGDEDPGWDEQTKTVRVDILERAAATGQTPGAARADIDLGN